MRYRGSGQGAFDLSPTYYVEQSHPFLFSKSRVSSQPLYARPWACHSVVVLRREADPFLVPLRAVLALSIPKSAGSFKVARLCHPHDMSVSAAGRAD